MPNAISFFQKLLPVTSCLGIEFNDTSIKIAELSIRRRKPPLLKFVHTEFVPEGAIEDGRILDPVVVTRTVQTMLTRLSPSTKSVHMVLPSQSIMVRFLKFPDVPIKDLRKLIDFEMKHHIHLPFEQPVYDFIKLNGKQETRRFAKDKNRKPQPSVHSEEMDAGFKQVAASKETSWDLSNLDRLFGDSSMETNEQEFQKLQCDVMLVATPRDLVDEYMHVLQDGGLKVKSLEIKALSLYRLIESIGHTDDQSTFLVVDINEKVTDVSIFQEGILKITRNIPLPFSSEFHLSKAEDDLAFTESSDQDADFRSTCSELAHELERIMNFYRYTLNNRNQQIHRLLLTGDVSRLKEISEILGERLSLEIQRLYSNAFQTESVVEEERFPAYAVPIGLALRGVQE